MNTFNFFFTAFPNALKFYMVNTNCFLHQKKMTCSEKSLFHVKIIKVKKNIISIEY